MTEKEYRLQRLKNRFSFLINKKIALYGTGKNAEAIIEEFPALDIIVLIAPDNTGKYIYGKKVITFEEVIFLQVDIIIIAAEAQAEKQIVDRIALECLKCHIKLWNMYGIDVLDAIRENIIQDINYKDLDSKKIRQNICHSDAVCFELMGVLCESRFYNKESMWRYVEEKSKTNQFCYNRQQAEEQRLLYMPYSISDIYASYYVNTFADISEADELCRLEEEIFLESIVPRRKMVEMLQYAIDKEKKVYLISGLPYSVKMLHKLLGNIGIAESVTIIQENLGQRTISSGLLRVALGEDLDRKALYFGTKESLGYFIAKSYDMKRFMIKSTGENIEKIAEIPYRENLSNIEQLDAFKSWFIKEYNSPFYQDNQWKSLAAFGNLKNINEYKGEELDLISLQISDNINDYNFFEVPQYEEIDVSIIIPVYNHFEYTYACLQSIVKNTLKVPYEVIIADDNSTDLTKRITEMVKGVKVIRNTENLLFLKNCNHAVHYASGKYLVFLNNDTQVRYNWLYPLTYLLDSDETIGLVGSKLLFPDGTVQEAGGVIYKDGNAANFGRGKNPRLPELNYIREADYISGASIMIRHELWDKIGGFDERFAPAYCEDSDLAFEVRKNGMRVVYQPASEVVHFEGISNGTDTSEGIKKYQEINRLKLLEKWKHTLVYQNNHCEAEMFAAKDRKQKRKTVLFISGMVPKYDCDAGSKTIMNYLRLFLKHGYIVKFWPTYMYAIQPYTQKLQQMGIEVFYGEDMQVKMSAWLLEHQRDIDYAFVNYPVVGDEVIDLLKMTSIKIRYYGHDLHYLRLRREYELTNEGSCLLQSKAFYEKEKEIIRKSEWVYYPSDIEITIVKKEFGKENAKQISPYMYDGEDIFAYEPKDREGILFIGGTHGPNEDAVLWFLTEIYPIIYQEKRIPFYLVGVDYSDRIQQTRIDGVKNIGHVTDEELADLYHKVRIVVVPLRYGAGIKGKVVDAMYHKVPIISTSVGIEGIATAEKSVKIANNAEKFCKTVINLYDNYEELRSMSAQYNGIIQNYFSTDVAWEKIKDEFE